MIAGLSNMEESFCPYCKLNQAISEFKYCYGRRCRTCYVETVREWRRQNLTKYKQSNSKSNIVKRKERCQNSYNWRKANKVKANAYNIVHRAIKSGKILKQNCIICGDLAQAHHDDYTKPLEIIWLCAKHHKERHGSLL
jgi:hypothetical protein